MRNADALKREKDAIFQRINTAIADGDQEGFAQAFAEFSKVLEEGVMLEARGLVSANDVSVLSGRGIRQLTSEETNYYTDVIQAMRSSNPQQALTDLEVVMPKTVIDDVFADLEQTHPLLDAIRFENTSGLIEYLVNTSEKQLAAWGTLTSEIVKELSGGFKKIDLEHNKLSAWLPVAKSMLDLGPVWLDRYVRAILAEALAYGLEEGIINGTGKDMPIGMNRQVGDGVSVTDGVYPVKEVIKVTALDPVSYGDLVSRVAQAPNGKYRVVTKVMLVVNPVDYLKKVMPATTIMRPDGTYANDVFPFPTDPVQSAQVPEGKAILGIAEKYFMGVGTAKDGKIEYSDEYKFLEDERTYAVKLYGHGQPLDNNAFLYLDISALEPAAYKVSLVGGGTTPVNP